MTDSTSTERGLSLAPFRATRFSLSVDDLGARLSPPYDVISETDRATLVKASSSNVVRVILPGQDEAALAGGDRYAGAKLLLDSWITEGTLVVDETPAIFVYEMQTPDGAVTRGLLGAVELRDPDDAVILPHENTMAGPVSDRLSLMSATEANLEPIYLVYDGGGAASELVRSVSLLPTVSEAVTPDGIVHRLWAVTDPTMLTKVAADLGSRRALIADGHHRYATYRQLQADHSGTPGPWDRGLTLLVDTSSYGPQVHPIHRVVSQPLEKLIATTRTVADVGAPTRIAQAVNALQEVEGFALVLATSDDEAVLISALDPAVIERGLGGDAATPLGALDITVLHRVLVESVWSLADTVDNVGYAHSVSEALDAAAAIGGTAVLVRPTPVQAVADVAAAGLRMPRKSTLFTPKPASGMVIRRFADQ